MMDANTTPEYLAQSHQVSESKRIEEHSTCGGEWFQFPVDIDLAPPKAMKAALSEPSLDWQEHIAPGGIIYYYNKKTMQSSWEKPVELMTPLERADASTEWKEFCTPDGQRYYYNKVTKQSEWHIPDELKVARELALKAANQQDQEMGKSSGSLVGSVSAEHLVHNYSNLSLVA